MQNTRIAVIIVMLFYFPCAAFASQVVLGSGQVLEVLNQGPLALNGGKTAAFQLQYRASVSLNNKAALAQEVNEIWDQLAFAVEKTSYQEVLISAEGPDEEEELLPDGMKRRLRHSYGFVFTKKNGLWRLSEDKSRTELDNAFVAAFLERLDWLYSHAEINAFLLYLADDWKNMLTRGKDDAPKLQDRLTFASETRAALAITKDFHHERKIQKIQISEDGKKAKVESNEIEEGYVHDENIRLTEHNIDYLELRDGMVLVTKSETFMNKK